MIWSDLDLDLDSHSVVKNPDFVAWFGNLQA